MTLPIFQPLLLSLLPECHFAQGNDVHGAGGRGSKLAQMQLCIRALRSVTSSGEDSVNQDLCDQGVINQLLGKLNQSSAGAEH